MKSGMLITFEGIDGCGKTTQIEMACEWLEKQGYAVLSTFQPGGTEVGRQIREILLKRKNRSLLQETELLLYLADRVQHLKEVILPAIEDGKLVLSDRFHDSTVAYQGFGRGVDLSLIQSIEENVINPHAPDLTFLFRIDPGISMKRIDDQRSSAGQRDRLEKEPLEFFQRISDGYEQLVQSSPQRFVCLDATASRKQIHQSIIRILKQRLKSIQSQENRS